MPWLLALAAGFSTGIFFRSLYIFSWPVYAFALLFAAIAAVAWFFARRAPYALGALFLLCAVLGGARLALSDTPLPSAFAHDLHHQVTYEGVIATDPDIRDTNQHLAVRVAQRGESTVILAIVALGHAYEVGERVWVSGVLTTPEPFSDSAEAGRIFRYDKYLEKDGIRFMISYASVTIEQKAPWYSPSAFFARIKHSYLSGLSSVMPNPYAALAGGVVIGGKQSLGKDLQNNFVTSGLIAIVVLSGYNVMVAARGIMYLLGFLKIRRRYVALAGAAAVVLFVLIAGVTSTALRAALMALIALFARAAGRTYAAGRALLSVIVLMLIWNPLLLVFDPGFDLSVAATAGIIWLFQKIEARLQKITSLFWRELLATTLAAQIAVLPLLLYETGRLSLVAIPANLIVLPFIPLLMASAAFAGVLGMLFGSTAFLFGLPAYLLSAYVIFIARVSAALPFAAVLLPTFSFTLVVLAYTALIFIASSKRFSIKLQFTFFKKASI